MPTRLCAFRTHSSDPDQRCVPEWHSPEQVCGCEDKFFRETGWDETTVGWDELQVSGAPLAPATATVGWQLPSE